MTTTSIIVGSIAMVFTPILIRKILGIEKITPASVVINRTRGTELEILDLEMNMRLARSEQNLEKLENLIKNEKNEDEKKSLIIDADELKDIIFKIKDVRKEISRDIRKNHDKQLHLETYSHSY